MFSNAMEAVEASPTQPCLIQCQLVQDIHNQPACIYFHRRSGYGRGGGALLVVHTSSSYFRYTSSLPQVKPLLPLIKIPDPLLRYAIP